MTKEIQHAREMLRIDPHKAGRLAEKILESESPAESKWEAALVLGNALRRMGRMGKAKRALILSYRFTNAVLDSGQRQKALDEISSSLTSFYRENRELAKAEECCAERLRRSDRAGSLARIGEALLDLALIHWMRGRPDATLTCASVALGLVESPIHRKSAAEAVISSAISLDCPRSSAIAKAARIVDSLRGKDSGLSKVRSDWLRARCLAQHGEITRAVEELDGVIEGFREYHDPLSVALASLDLAEGLIHLGFPSRACQIARRLFSEFSAIRRFDKEKAAALRIFVAASNRSDLSLELIGATRKSLS